MGIRGKGLEPVRSGPGTKKNYVAYVREKKVGGDKNGGKRVVRVNKMVS